eukprot:364849-Chlamydomonas_euryale.AAC.14
MAYWSKPALTSRTSASSYEHNKDRDKQAIVGPAGAASGEGRVALTRAKQLGGRQERQGGEGSGPRNRTSE